MNYVPLVPTEMFLTNGVGKHKEELASFEQALRDAGIERCNLVYVSSIFPPKCKQITRAKGLEKLVAGQISFAVVSRNNTNEPHRLITASVGLAKPRDKKVHGYISEHHANGKNKKESGEYAEDLAAQMLASTLGIPFNPEEDYDKRKEEYRMSGKIVRSQNITSSIKGDKNGLWTTVVAAAVFLLDCNDPFTEFLKEKHSEEYKSWYKERYGSKK
jgi:arginine decarboxylase